jgi:small multidrug resistance pump
MTRVTIYLCLAGSILAEVVATIALAESESLTKPIPGVISVVCFVAAFWLLSFPLRTMPAGIVYAVWSGLAIVLITPLPRSGPSRRWMCRCSSASSSLRSA